MSDAARMKIGSWRVSPALNRLEHGTRSVKIEPRAMDVLVFLAGHAGRVVSIEELMAAVWKDVVVGEGSVYLAIRQLRQTLDDGIEGSSYLETIPKRGYRLTVPVERLEPDAELAQVTAPADPRRRIAQPLAWKLVAILAGTALIAVVAMGLRDRAQPVAANSVAVLPFDNLSSDPEQEYFADGVTVEVLDALSRIRDLRVTGRNSSFHFKDRSDDRSQIGAVLGVKHIVVGSVRKAGDQLRVTAQLNNARTGQQLWSETYTRKVGDIFQIQEEIARSVANALQVKLGVGDMARVPGMTRDVAAYAEYLRGMALNLEFRSESFPHAFTCSAPSLSILRFRLHGPV